MMTGNTDQKTEIREWRGRHRLFAWINTILMVLFALFLVVGANILGNRYYFRTDITREQNFHLTDETIAVIRNLSKDITVYVYGSGIMAQADSQIVAHQNAWKKIGDMLAEYTAHTNRITVNPLTESDANLIRQTEKDFPLLSPNDILFACEKRYETVNSNELYQSDNFTGRITRFSGEKFFTNAIKKISTGRAPAIYFTSGHGEVEFTSQNSYNISQVRYALAVRENCKVEALNILDNGIPDTCDLLCIVGPQRAFSPLEIGAIEGYLRHGGRLFITLGTLYRDHGLDNFLRAWGIEPNIDMICDEKSFPQAEQLYANRRWPTVAAGDNFTARHPINARIGDLTVIFPLCNSFDVTPTISGEGIAIRADVVVASAPAFAETDLSFLRHGSDQRPRFDAGVDRQGRLPMLVAVEGEMKGGGADGKSLKPRIVACGSTDFALAYLACYAPLPTQEMLPTNNLHYLMNCFRWLMDKENEIAIPEKNFKQGPLELKPEQATRIQVLSLFVFPAFGIFLGLIVWFFRRK